MDFKEHIPTSVEKGWERESLVWLMSRANEGKTNGGEYLEGSEEARISSVLLLTRARDLEETHSSSKGERSARRKGRKGSQSEGTRMDEERTSSTRLTNSSNLCLRIHLSHLQSPVSNHPTPLPNSHEKKEVISSSLARERTIRSREDENSSSPNLNPSSLPQNLPQHSRLKLEVQSVQITEII